MSVLKIACAIAVGFIGIGAFLGKKSPSSTSPAVAAVPPAPEVRLINFRCSSEYGFTTTEGTVKNISDKPIQSLMVVGTHFATSGEFVKSDSAMVEYQPLMPGQTSPFKTMSTYNPMMAKCSVNFKRMFGGEVATAR